jgi:rod shape-determining protein MreD
MGIKMISTRKKRKYAVIRWLVFSVIIWFAFIFMTTGSFMKPNILIPVALCISMDEDALVSAVIGFICGFLSDLAMGNLIGSGAIVLICGCVCTSLLFTRLLRQILLNFSVIMIIYSAVHFSFKYFFSYMIWGYDKELILLEEYILPEFILTVVSMIFVYPVIRKIRKHLTLRKRYEPEDNQALIKD